MLKFTPTLLSLLLLTACKGGDTSDGSNAVNHFPAAVADSFTTVKGVTVSDSVAINDTGTEDTPVTYSVVANNHAVHGTFILLPNGLFTYTPLADFVGTDTFTYQVEDRNLDKSTADITITVTAGSGVVWPAANSVIPTDAKIEADVTALVAKMSVAEKVAQMTQAEIHSVTAENIRKYHLGSVLNGGGSVPGFNKQATVKNWVDLADTFYNASVDTTLGGQGIPIIWGTDAVHGHNNVYGATVFPHNIGLGAAHNPDLIKSIGAATAAEVAVTGIDWVFAPTIAVVRDDRWGRSYESYSEDPEIVHSYAGKIIEGLQGAMSDNDVLSSSHVIATAKHFLGDGGTTNGTNEGNNTATEQELLDIHAQGYLSAINAGAQTVMASFNSWQGNKIHGSQYLLTYVLKQQMGFDGFVISDWNGHAQVTGCSTTHCPQAINAGVDMMMVPNDWEKFIENTVADVNNGLISQDRINDAVTRILRVKMRAGLFKKIAPSNRDLANQSAQFNSIEHRNIARQAVRESLVLLKNKNNLLPLNRNLRVLVAGNGANNIPKQTGGWTLTWQGTGNSNSDFPNATSIYKGIDSVVTAAGGTTILNEAGDYSGATPDVAIVVYGEDPYAETAGDITQLEYQLGTKTDLALLKKIRANGIPVVSVFLTGRPLWMNKELNASNAFVAAWLPGTEGAGVADVIFKAADNTIAFDFKGKLSRSWPIASNQYLLNRYDTNYNPLFAYGFGLTYQDTDTLSDSLSEVSN